MITNEAAWSRAVVELADRAATVAAELGGRGDAAVIAVGLDGGPEEQAALVEQLGESFSALSTTAPAVPSIVFDADARSWYGIPPLQGLRIEVVPSAVLSYHVWHSRAIEAEVLPVCSLALPPLPRREREAAALLLLALGLYLRREVIRSLGCESFMDACAASGAVVEHEGMLAAANLPLAPQHWIGETYPVISLVHLLATLPLEPSDALRVAHRLRHGQHGVAAEAYIEALSELERWVSGATLLPWVALLRRMRLGTRALGLLARQDGIPAEERALATAAVIVAMRREDGMAEAERALEELVGHPALGGPATLARAKSLRVRGDPAGARALLERLARSGTVRDSYLAAEFAELSSDIGDTSTADEVTAELLERLPRDGVVRELTGRHSSRNGRWSQAERELKAALALEPWNFRYALTLAEYYFSRGHLRDAARAIAVGLDVDADRAELLVMKRDLAGASAGTVRRTTAWPKRRGSVLPPRLNLSASTAELIDALRVAVRSHPFGALLRLELSEMLQLREATELLADGLRLDPDNAHFAAALGRHLRLTDPVRSAELRALARTHGVNGAI